MSRSSTNQRVASQPEAIDPVDPALAAEQTGGFEPIEELGDGFEVLEETDPLGRVRVRMRTDRAQQLRCVYCHETLAREEVEKCPACNAYVHSDCAALLNGCSTLGCAGRIAPLKQTPTEARGASILRNAGGWLADLLASAAFGVVFGLVAAAAGELILVAARLEGALGPLAMRLARDAFPILVGLLVFSLRLRGQRRRRKLHEQN